MARGWCRRYARYEPPGGVSHEIRMVGAVTTRSIYQACLVAALPCLLARESVTTVAIDLDYGNPATFSTMFRRVFGEAPRRYLSFDGHG